MISFTFKQAVGGLVLSLSVEVEPEALVRALQDDEGQWPASGIQDEERAAIRRPLQREALELLHEVNERLQISLQRAALGLLEVERS